MKTKEDWQQKLSPEAFKVCREKGTERPFSGKYTDYKENGTYICVCCGQVLFSSSCKFDSGSGWPSFWQSEVAKNVLEHTDSSLGMSRVEVVCSNCDSHLGHVFEDGPQPTGRRFCINSVALEFSPAEKKSDT